MDGTGETYRLAAPSGSLLWREWDDGCVVFNLATGETHYLDDFTAYLLRLVETSAQTADALTGTVCAELGREHSAALEAQIGRALRNFEVLALLEKTR
ncbi:HPr-rel-A system PqqD family peptide chaperone [Emcibacter sp. SYSU 3D8]|uniref:HPr-rel-A system PqqD family peptide chaperone n=1 Tax=Emcibacter sp. SYSU 3D8 TaxID=3133969 RepID=UPI0031FF07F1